MALFCTVVDRHLAVICGSYVFHYNYINQGIGLWGATLPNVLLPGGTLIDTVSRQMFNFHNDGYQLVACTVRTCIPHQD